MELKTKNHPIWYVYSFDIYSRYLIRAESQSDYKSKLIGRWSPPFQTYFLVNVNSDIWLFSLQLAKEINFPYTENSIFTSNGSEHLNYLATALQEFKEVPLHHMFFLGRDLRRECCGRSPQLTWTEATTRS